MERLAYRMLDYAKYIISPEVAYAIHPVTAIDSQKGACTKSGSYIELTSEEQDVSVAFLVAVVCTLGPELDKEIKNLTVQGNTLEGMFLDAAGVVLLESLGTKCRLYLKKEAEKHGLFAGCPFGPGYGKIPLDSQRELFMHVDTDALGITLNETGIMIPLKSVSFWLKWTTNFQATNNHRYKCQRCALESCLYRKIPYLAK